MIPYSEILLDKVCDKLRTVTPENGYGVNIALVQRYDHDDLVTFPRPCAHVFRTDERKARSGNAWEVSLEVTILVYLFQHSSEARPTESVEAHAGADLEAALCSLEEDVDFRAVLGVLDTELFALPAEEENVDVGVSVTMEIWYRTDFRDPSTPIDPR